MSLLRCFLPYGRVVVFMTHFLSKFYFYLCVLYIKNVRAVWTNIFFFFIVCYESDMHFSGKARYRLFMSLGKLVPIYSFLGPGKLATISSFLWESSLPSVHFSWKAGYRLFISLGKLVTVLLEILFKS